MLNNDKKTFLLLLVACITVLTYFHVVLKETIESPFVDFGHYWINASLLKEGYNAWERDTLIEKKITEITQSQKIIITSLPIHSPGFFVFIMPFAFLPFRWAVLLWLMIGYLLLFYSLWIILKIERGRPSWEDVFVVLFLVFSFWPLREELHLAQPDFFILFFLVSTIALLKKGRLFWAGVVLGIAFQFREYLVIAMLFFLLKKKWRVVIGVISSVVALKLIAAFLFGWAGEIAYWKYLFSMFGKIAPPSTLNVSVFAPLYRIVNGQFGKIFYIACALSCIGIFIGKAVFWIRNSKDSILEFCLFLTLPFLVSPWVHEQHFVVLYPAIIILWFRLERRENARYYFLFIISYLFLGLGYSLARFSLFRSGILAIFTGGKVIGIIILFFLIGMLIKEDSLLIKDSKWN